MRRFARLIIVAIGLTVLALVVILVPHRDVNAQSPTQVQVVNTPLPISGVVAVRGGVAVTNTPLPVTVRGIAVGAPLPVVGNVSVANFPSTQAVSFSNTVSSPLFVQDTGAAGRYPFTLSVNNQGSPTDTTSTHSGGSVILPPSPTNGTAIAVIEFVSTICLVPPNVPGPGVLDIISLSTTLGSTGNVSTFFLTAQTQSFENTGFGGEVWATYQTKIYANAGASVNVGLPGNNDGCALSVSGSLLPQ